jgi:8-oxo-dGTP diphosphatase
MLFAYMLNADMQDAEFSKQFLPEVAVDVVLLSIGAAGRLQTLLSKRAEAPFDGAWALPGVFVGRDEPLEAAAARALRDKAGIGGVFVEQLFTFGDVRRDPRGRVISVAYYALVPPDRFAAATAHDAESAVANVDVPSDELGAVRTRDAAGTELPLAFDHERIIGMAVQRIRGKLNYAPIGFELLPQRFTLLDLQRIHEAVLGRKLNKDSFRRKMLASGLIEDTHHRQTGTSFRPAALYRFKKEEHSAHG